MSWGEDCGNLTDGDCKLVDACQKCSWSWPVDDPLSWNSADAKCRCNQNGHKSEFWYSGPRETEPKKAKKPEPEAEPVVEEPIVEEVEETPAPPQFKGELEWGLDCENLTD